MENNKTRFIVFQEMLGLFAFYLIALGFFLANLVSGALSVDAATAAFSGVGGGTVLGFFIAKIGDAWQFYWRTSGNPPEPPPPTP